ncbi:hypothetical protein LPB72_17495 [Hydrogenophaga crassostreae]|uniref:Uncharacterized protein n=1 Tax=Hydrogenophaga crassostreae TaxID=1763535 RepID=A0A163C7V7_9BURK|nr:hypothetical protein LPB072_08000 [Hydrogenophaga crassostreae]OAD39981.1 hypothetical protein LPB72_17495 [Hydrogenophaga crassostreae]
MSNSVAWIALPVGIWFLLIALLGVVRGYLPTQASVLVRSRTVYRDDEPFVFWSNLALVAAAGAALCFIAIGFLTR